MSNRSAILDLVHGISSPLPANRARSADAVTDIAERMAEREVDLVARLLVTARLTEQELDCRESQLHALAELAEWHGVSTAVLAPLAQGRAEAVGSEIEYLGLSA